MSAQEHQHSPARGHRAVVLSDYKAKKMDEGAIDLQLDDGTTVTVPPAQVWADDVMVCASAGDLIGAGIALLGKDEYDHFVRAGGSGALLSALVQDELGLTTGESPASPAS